MKNILLQGVTGSKAYGLDTPDSDTDYLGIFARPTMELCLLTQMSPSVVSNDPDCTLHEAGKYCSLALRCNPTIMDLLWLDTGGGYVQTSALGYELISIRDAFLSENYVRNSYFGYAQGQFNRLKNRNNGSFSADTRKRTAKHARHLARLLDQGYKLHRTGYLHVKVEHPEFFYGFGDQVADGDTQAAADLISDYEAMWAGTTGVLPAQPDTERVLSWLKRVRREHWDG